jgi:hypothetical protein
MCLQSDRHAGNNHPRAKNGQTFGGSRAGLEVDVCRYAYVERNYGPLKKYFASKGNLIIQLAPRQPLGPFGLVHR